ncbi:hypothetical protein SCANT_v1c06490 [Spiroplasma cantharicola]|uniref:Uncharacterized protein n=1 Tax=Spiroplasma cantharicola TaxID=362837 RepID=A0A0M4JWZ3_9MOLU|nr:hypothetical protein SCANT_v1c06490 [Spiroplasma cantharicola]
MNKALKIVKLKINSDLDFKIDLIKLVTFVQRFIF